jgi:hypothetical protein
MTEIDVPIPNGVDVLQIERHVEMAAAAAGLEQRLKGSLAKYRGATHWHFSRPGTRGTLEMTWWPGQRRCWISLRESRSSEWIAGAVQEILAELGLALHSTPAASHVDS